MPNLENHLERSVSSVGLLQRFALTGNQIKLLAMFTMLIDHIGLLLLPDVIVLRWIGRLSFPLFAYMIGEGCLHTRHKLRYLLQVAVLAAVCQVAFFLTRDGLYFGVLCTFTCSILLCYGVQYAQTHQTMAAWLWPALGVGGAVLLNVGLPYLLPTFHLDYGLWGTLLPLCVVLFPLRQQRLLATAVCLCLLSLSSGAWQWWCLLALIPLFLYNEERGKWKMKYLFYGFYPIHMVVLTGIGMLL